ncbi:MAG: hypothetical protein JSR91_08715 [Proteobacteria bacterium]|nr:hypothetical protein [Pseudomonadota bacterium]
MDNLAQMGAVYGEASFIFVVSDSQDGTISILEQWLSVGRRGRVVDLGNLQRQLPLRTERIAFVRNASLDQVRNGQEMTYDHLIVVDLDDVLKVPMSMDAFARAAHWLDAAPTRGGVFANGSPRYYDIWALRHEVWCPHDCWHPVWYRDPSQDQYSLQIREVYARMVKIPSWLPPIRVQSAFGGVGIYKLKLTAGASYVGIDEHGRETCEHVTFNAGVRNAGGRLHIFPRLVTHSPAEHVEQFRNFPKRLRPMMAAHRMLMTLRWWLAGPFRQTERKGQ